MFFIIGVITVIGCVLGGYVLHHGNLAVLNQPTEFLIIGGSGIGSFIISNPPGLVKQSLGSFKYLLKSRPYKKADYIELLLFLYNVCKFMKTKGLLEMEKQMEEPEGSELYNKYPTFMKNHHALDFFNDYIRLLTMGVDNQYQLEDMMNAELEEHHHHKETISSAIVTLGDSFPALGIVAAVLGVIITMGSITEPPEILGGLIGAALVGTFLGILLAYGFVGPMGQYIGKFFAEEHKYYECIKTAILAHVQGNAPAVTVEYARKMIPGDVMPSFKEFEEAMEAAGD